MRYRIGELAEFFGMTKPGIRYLEQQGIIRSVRDERNGYRYYPREEITHLKLIRSYQAVGFTLEEAQSMMYETLRADIANRLDEKIHELEEKETQLRRMRQMLIEQQKATRSILDREASYEIVQRPEYLLFPRVPDEVSGATPAEKVSIAHARQVEKEWIRNMPPVTLGALHYDAQGNIIYNLFGSVLSAAAVEKLQLTVLLEMIRIPACTCAHGFLEHPAGKRPQISELFAWIDSQNLRPCGDVFGLIRLNYRGDQGELLRLEEVFVPVCEKK